MKRASVIEKKMLSTTAELLFSHGKLMEFPVSNINFLGIRFPFGGGYLRLLSCLPERTFSNIVERHIQTNYSLFYVHPREIDVGDIPSLPISNPIKHFKTYVGIGKQSGRIREIFNLRGFSSICSYLKGIEEINNVSGQDQMIGDQLCL